MMKKITQEAKKAQNSNAQSSNRYLIILLVCLSTKCFSQTIDQVVSDKISYNLCNTETDTIYITLSSDKNLLLKIYEENFKDSTLYKQEKSKEWLSKKAGETYQDDSKLIRQVFSSENYDYIKRSTASNFKWNSNKASHNCIIKEINKHMRNSAVITKPYYTKDGNYALCHYSYREASGIYIFKRRKSKWLFFKYLPL